MSARQWWRSFGDQVRRNLVALISLIVAVSSLGYNTWRNERTEANRNVRQAAFQMIERLAELHLIVFYAHYEADPERGNPTLGWVHVVALEDLSHGMPVEVRETFGALQRSWRQHSRALEDPEAHSEIDGAIDDTRRAIGKALEALD